MTARTPPGLQSFAGCDGQVKQGEQEILHARDSVGQNSGATQWCPGLDLATEFGIRDPQAYQLRGLVDIEHVVR